MRRFFELQCIAPEKKSSALGSNELDSAKSTFQCCIWNRQHKPTWSKPWVVYCHHYPENATSLRHIRSAPNDPALTKSDHAFERRNLLRNPLLWATHTYIHQNDFNWRTPQKKMASSKQKMSSTKSTYSKFSVVSLNHWAWNLFILTHQLGKDGYQADLSHQCTFSAHIRTSHQNNSSIV